ncbi:MAG: flavin-dependent oxidoreductase [Saccharopolyspora sp.]|uniref:flavin-dependent oxidoreductase n=1 Tax=Saccharopolyspora sp. TaxID=33915 RepID=UPI0025D407F2|nr:flavin-dependent oxidoreductase [Saccharopolyspora sp.]MBQ6640822.1 flavin-dependent oxidoreductase [Saccharopolyspora sp.]
MQVIIVGAGIGGLTAALRLHQEGIDCVVYEQSEQSGELGVGINALPHAVKELAELGLLDSLDEIGVRTRDLYYAHRLGPVILRKPCGLDAGFTLPQFCLHRGRLQGMLLRAVRERLGADAVRTGHRLTGFDQDASEVRAHFDRRGAAPVTVRGDVLVAADGIHSAARSILFPAEGAPRWNGVLMWRGATDWPEFDGGRSMIVAGGTAAKLVIYPIAEGRSAGTKLTNWAVCIRTGQPGAAPPERQDWARPGDRRELARHVERFCSPAVDHAGLVEATEEIFEFPMCDRDPLPAWSRGRVTLLGDAAHPMYPMGSNGAGQAILDATALGGHLARCSDPTEALLAYQDDRLAATSEVVLRNREGGPENVIDEVERRAPQGFSHIDEVIDAAELEAVVAGYARASGSSQQQVNEPGR